MSVPYCALCQIHLYHYSPIATLRKELNCPSTLFLCWPKFQMHYHHRWHSKTMLSVCTPHGSSIITVKLYRRLLSTYPCNDWIIGDKLKWSCKGMHIISTFNQMLSTYQPSLAVLNGVVPSAIVDDGDAIAALRRYKDCNFAWHL